MLRRAIRVGLVFFALVGLSAVQAVNPDFVLTDVSGAKHRLSDYRGKWVVVNYWATWCPPCLVELPVLVRFHERHKDRDAVVLGVNLEGKEAAELHGFIAENFITFPVLLGKPGEELPWPVPGLPTTYIVSPEGKVAARHIGPLTGVELEEFIGSQNQASNL
ncbi:MAG: TlpA disulfide reductase family protein [Gammaproteobacteria bacterium]